MFKVRPRWLPTEWRPGGPHGYGVALSHEDTMLDLSKANDSFVRSHITVSLYEFACLSKIRSARRFKKCVVAVPAPPVHEKIKGTNEACSTSRTR